MPMFKYVGAEPRVYPHLSLDAEPGEVYELAEAPAADGRWEEVAAEPKPKSAKAESKES